MNNLPLPVLEVILKRAFGKSDDPFDDADIFDEGGGSMARRAQLSLVCKCGLVKSVAMLRKCHP